MSWYRVGVLSVTQNSAVVTASGTQFGIKASPGYAIAIEGLIYEVASVDSNTQLTLATPYAGATSSSAKYAIFPTQAELVQAWRTMTDLVETFGPLRNNMEELNAAMASAHDAAELADEAATTLNGLIDTATTAATEAQAGASAVAADKATVQSERALTEAARGAAGTSETNAKASELASAASAEAVEQDKIATAALKAATDLAKQATELAKTDTLAAQDAAEQAQGFAEIAQAAAEAARNAAQTAQAAAEAARDDAKAHKDAAAASASAAAADRSATEAAKAAVLAAQAAAEAARDDAEGHRDAAQGYAADALASKQAAATSETHVANLAEEVETAHAAILASEASVEDLAGQVETTKGVVVAAEANVTTLAGQVAIAKTAVEITVSGISALVGQATSDKAAAEAAAGIATDKAADAIDAADRAEVAAAAAEDIAGGQFVPLSAKGVPGGVATLDSSGKVPSSQIDGSAIPYPVTSVAGRTGDVVPTKADVGLSNADNTSDADKPVSTAQAAAIALKAPIASPALTGTPTAPTAAQFDNSTKLATTEFVRKGGIQASGVTPISASGALDASVAGGMVSINGSGLTLTLPGASSFLPGTAIILASGGAGNVIQRAGTDQITLNPGGGVNSVTMGLGDTLILTTNASGQYWNAIGGSMVVPGSSSARGAFAYQGKQSIWIPATAISPLVSPNATPSVGAANVPTSNIAAATLDYDPSAIEWAQFQWQMPKQWDGGAVSAKFSWSHVATATNFKVVWGITGAAFGDGDLMAAEGKFGGNQTVVSTGGVANTWYVSPETATFTVGNSPVAEDMVTFFVFRSATDATNDTLAVDARLHGVTLYINTNKANDA